MASAARTAVPSVAIALTLVVFANAQDRSQTIVIVLIALVFVSLRATMATAACAPPRVAILLENEIRAVRRDPL